MDENRRLKEYWIDIGMEYVCPWEKVSESDKAILAGTFGFARYNLTMKYEKLRKEVIKIVSPLMQWILRLFKIK